MPEEEPQPWFVFTVQDTEGGGVEVSKLARLLNNLSATFYAIARAKIGMAGPRPGRRTVVEDMLAAIRLVRVEPGSTTIELAPPPVATQGRLALLDELTPDDVAFELYEEVQRIEAGEPVAEEKWDIRRHVRTIIEDAGEIGSRAEIVYRPLFPRPNFPTTPVLRASFRTRDIPEEKLLARSTRRRRLSGHAYMVDVEPGRQRLRIKLPDGRDLTLDVKEELLSQIPFALDQAVEIEVEEEWERDVAIRRIAHGVNILPSSGPGSDKPPKSIRELEREQNLPEERPDYAALASAIWETEEDVSHFEQHIRQIREAETA